MSGCDIKLYCMTGHRNLYFSIHTPIVGNCMKSIPIKLSNEILSKLNIENRVTHTLKMQLFKRDFIGQNNERRPTI
jgi:hypothetical protein